MTYACFKFKLKIAKDTTQAVVLLVVLLLGVALEIYQSIHLLLVFFKLASCLGG